MTACRGNPQNSIPCLLAGAMLGLPESALALDSGRMMLLAREAADVLAPAPAFSPTFLAAVALVALAAALLGTWIGSRGRRADRAGELTFRFRSPGPVRVDSTMLARMTGALDGGGESLALAAAAAGRAAAPQRSVSFRRDTRVPRRIVWTPAVTATAAAPTATTRAALRAERYATARKLLREGVASERIRDRTGLKLAEIDLLRCAPGNSE